MVPLSGFLNYYVVSLRYLRGAPVVLTHGASEVSPWFLNDASVAAVCYLPRATIVR